MSCHFSRDIVRLWMETSNCIRECIFCLDVSLIIGRDLCVVV